MKPSLEKRIILFSFIILFLSMFANTAMDVAVFRKHYIKGITLRAEGLGMSLASSLEKILALGISMADVSGLSGKCSEVIHSDPEMSYCRIIAPNGTILFSSDPDPGGAASNGSFRYGATPPGHPRLVDTPSGLYYDTALPVKSYDGSQAATVHIGFSRQAVDSKVHEVVIRSIAVFLLFLTVSFALVVIFIRRDIVAPVSALLKGIIRIGAGDFKRPVTELRVREFDELGARINDMATALDSRDTQLRASFDELSQTNARIHESYLQLEALSLELEKSEQLYKRLLEDASDAIVILDQGLTIVVANKKIAELTGCAAAELAGRHISSVLLQLGADAMPHVLRELGEVCIRGTITCETMLLIDGSSPIVAMVNGSCVTIGDDSLLQVIIRDVTRERELVANLESSAAGLARLNRMKDSFLGMASHELKTPLTVIMGYSELLQSDPTLLLPDASLEMIRNISTAAARLDCIVKDMIDVSLIDQRQLELRLADVSINEIIKETLREFSFFFTLRKQTVREELGDGLPLLRGDHNRLMQLFSNLVGNAVKFTPDGGEILIRTDLRLVMEQEFPLGSELTPDGEGRSSGLPCIEVEIRDSGIGIDRDDQVRIFDKFFEAGDIQEHSSGKVEFKARGTGLGLSIAKGIVEMHGGVIRVESAGYDPRTCPGSSFYVLLPLDGGRIGDRIVGS